MEGIKKDFIIFSVFNYGAIDLALNLLQSIRNQNIDKYHISYVTDQESFYLMKKQGYQVELFDKINYNKEKNNFDSVEFNNISYARYHILKELITKYHNIWYLDTDIVVLDNLYQYYVDHIRNTNHVYDMIFHNYINMHCTGCFIVKSSDKIKRWIDLILEKQRNISDQIILKELIHNRLLDGYNIQLFRTDKFPNGLLYFSDLNENEFMRQHQLEYKNKTDKKTMLVHANYMVGIDKKIEAFKKHGIWFI